MEEMVWDLIVRIFNFSFVISLAGYAWCFGKGRISLE